MTTPQAAPQRFMQGIAIPATSVNPAEFFARTRRQTLLEQRFNYSHGQSNTTIELRKSDILSGIMIRFAGKLVVTPGTGTVSTTRRWPYDLLKLVRYTANGAANIISVSGAKLKARDVMKHSDLTSRGVTQKVGGVDVSHGTLSRASETWGVGSGAANVPAGTYDVELEWWVPVAEDDRDLQGASFLATSSSSLTLNLDFSTPAEMFTLTGAATAELSGAFEVVSTKYLVPIGADGQIVVPDLSVFHSLIESRATGMQHGPNETLIVGQGAGKSLLRVYAQVWNGTPPVPLKVANGNYGQLAWAYGGAEQHEAYPSANGHRHALERLYNDDIGGVHGFWGFDFVNENAFRDVIDMGTVNDLRLRYELPTALALNAPAIEYVVESVYLAGQSA